jgi:beta-glucosidase
VIFGQVNPSGRLPVSWPSEADAPGGDFCGDCPSPLGDQPKTFDQLPSTASGQGNAYNPLYPFGFGLSYTTFRPATCPRPDPSGGTDRRASASR